MGGKVVVRRSLAINRVVVTAENVREVAKRLAEEQSADLTVRDKERLRFTLIAADGTQYDTDDVGFLDVGGVLDTRRIVAIEMSFANWHEDMHSSLSLRHGKGGYKSDNSATVSGRDETWVNATIQWMSDCVANWRSQTTFPHRHSGVLFLAVMASLGMGTFMLVRFVAGILGWSREIRELMFYVFLLLLFPCGLGAMYVVGWLQELYPEVEFAMGPEHQRVEKGKREKVYRVVGLVLAPLIVGAVLELAIAIVGSLK